MFLTERVMAAKQAASQRVAEGKSYSVELPVVGRVPVPSPEQLAIYAALGGLAALELIDWPVAMAMGVGSALVGRHLSDLKEREDEIAESLQRAEPAPVAAKAAPPVAEKPVAEKAVARKAPAKKVTAKKATAAKVSAKKAPAKATRKRTPAAE